MFQGDDKGEDAKGKKKVPVRTIELPIEANVNGLSQRELDVALEKEVSLYFFLPALRNGKSLLYPSNSSGFFLYF